MTLIELAIKQLSEGHLKKDHPLHDLFAQHGYEPWNNTEHHEILKHKNKHHLIVVHRFAPPTNPNNPEVKVTHHHAGTGSSTNLYGYGDIKRHLENLHK